MARNSNTTLKLYSFVFAAIFILGVFVAITPPTGAQTASVLKVTEFDYTTPATAIFGNGVGYVVVTSAAQDTTDERDQILNVEVTTSSASTTKLIIDLLETGPKTGVFIGSFRVSDTTATTNGAAYPPYGRILGDGVLKVVPGDTITVRSITPSATVSNIKWFAAQSGKLRQYANVGARDADTSVADPCSGCITTAPPIIGWNSLIFFRVADADLNRITSGTGARETQNGFLKVWSDSDPTGEFLPLVETGSNSPLFDASVGFESFRVAGNNKVFVRGGDNVYSVYTDSRDANGVASTVELAPRTFMSATDGFVFFESSTVAGQIAQAPSGSDRITVVVFDPDVDASLDAENPAVSITVGNAATCNVVLSERGPGGVYMATLGFSTTAPSCGSGNVPLTSSMGAYVLPLSNANARQSLRAIYSDSTDSSGVARLLEGNAQWVPARAGTITVGASSLVQRIVGTGSQHSIQVEDFDADRNPNAADKINVKVKSDSDPNSITVELLEDSFNSGQFFGTFGFNNAASAGSSLKVADKDFVVVTYDDAVGDDGRATRVLSDQRLVWRAASGATVSTDSTQYFYALRGASSDVTKPEVVARVFVDDSDRNDPRVRDTVNAQAVTLVAAGQTPQSATIQLTEVGVNSGVFTGLLKFSTCPTAGCASPAAADTLEMFQAASQAFRIEYSDPVGASQVPVLVSSATLTWNKIPAASGTKVVRAELDETTNYHVRDILPISARGGSAQPPVNSYTIALYGAPTTTDTVVDVLSGRCPEPKSFTLTDTGAGGAAGDGRVAASIPFINFISPDDADESCDLVAGVGVSQTDTITIRAGPGVSAQVFARPSAGASSALKNYAGADLSLSAPGFGQSLPFTIESSAANSNLVRGGRDAITVSLSSFSTGLTAAADDLSVLMVEDAADTGRFLGSFALSEAASNADNLQLLVNSELRGGWGHYPTSGPDQANNLPRLYDRISVSGAGGDTFVWYDGNSPTLRVIGDTFGTQGAFTIELAGDDVNTRRIRGDVIASTGATQRTFQLRTPYVPRSELVYATASQSVGPGAGTFNLLSQNVAAEPIADRTGDWAVTCADIGVTSSTAATFSCTGVNAAAGTVTVACSGALCGSTSTTVNYDYRLAYSSNPTSKFQYSRANDTQIRTGAEIGGVGSALKIDFTPQVQIVVAASQGETESFFVRWNEATQSYRGSLPVETSPVAGNGRIYVTGALTTVTFRFDDPVTLNGMPAPTQSSHFNAITTTGLWRTGGEASISFLTSDFQQTLTGRTFGPAIPVRVFDPDSDRSSQSDGLAIQAQKTGSTAVVEVLLREVGGNSGIFTGLIPVGTAAGELNLAAGDMVTARYNDPFGANGQPVTVASQIQWQPAQSGAIGLATTPAQVPAANPPTKVPGADGKLTVTVTDADANRDNGLRDKIKIRVISDANSTGEEFEITESNVPGVFVSGPIGFEATHVPNNGRVYARDNGFFQDRIFVVYEDPSNIQGRAVTQRSTPLVWDLTHDARVNLEFDQYFGTHANKVQVPPLTGLRPYATVTVAEGDCNANPGAVEFIEQKASNSDPCDIDRFALRVAQSSGSTGGNAIPLGALKLIETGANTGVFLASVTFQQTATDATGVRTALVVSNNDLLRASFNDASPAGGIASFQDEARWFSYGFGAVSLSAPGYNDLAVKPKVTIVDGNAAGTLSARVTSRADTTGISVNLVQTPTGSGFYTATFELTRDASSGGKLKVSNVDEIQVVYNDASPTGSRSAVAQVNLVDKTAPVTSLVTVPAVADGLHGVFKQKVLVGFASSEAGDTFYRVGASTVDTEWTGENFELDAGNHTIKFYSVDLFNNKEAERTQFVEVDLADPTSSVAGLIGLPGPGGSAKLNWTGIATTDPFEFFQYAVFRDAQATPVGTTKDANFTDSTLTDETAHTYQVAIEDKSGRRGPLSASVTVTPDRTLPVLSGATVSPTQFDLRKAPNAIVVSINVVEANLDQVKAAIVDSAGTQLKTAQLSLDSGTFRGNLEANLSQPCVCNVVFTALDKAGNKAEFKVSIKITGPDSQSPAVTFSNIADNGEIMLGTAVAVLVTDNVALSRVTYTLDNAAAVTVPIDATPESVTFTVATTGLALGTHTLRVEVEDNATNEDGVPTPNRVTQTKTFTVVEKLSEPGPLPGGSLFLVTRAEPQSDGSVRVTWDVPAAIANSGVAGYQVWRAASPFVLIANVSDANARSFTDESAVAGTVYRYVVTAFTTAPFSSLSQVPGYPGSDDAVQGSGPTTSSESGLPQWLWLVLGALALIAVAVIIAIPLMARQRRQQTTSRRAPPQQQVMVEPPVEPPAEAAAAAPATGSMQTHRLRCPQCSYRFEVTGSKPIVTNCPNCGRKGILR